MNNHTTTRQKLLLAGLMAGLLLISSQCQEERNVIDLSQFQPTAPTGEITGSPGVKFVPYEEPPWPIGGYAAIREHVVYPEEAQEAGIEGTVIVQVFITEDGKAEKMLVLENKSGDTSLGEAAMAAIRPVTWEPAKQKDKPVGVWISTPVNFSLKDDTGDASESESKPPTSEITGSLTPVAEMTNSTPEVQSQAPRVVGKIYGVVSMEETGEPLPGANIVLEGTRMGAATDNNGQYFIINVPPGTYTLRASMLGFFESVAFGEVIVKVMESTEVNFSLKVIRLEGETKVAPPPPPPEEGPTVRFVPYDEPPKPIGGYAAIQQHVVYPQVANDAGIEGTVIVQAFVDENGRVEKTVILQGIPNTGLDEAAADAIRQVTWEPAKQKDKPVGVWISTPVNFRLSK